MASQDFADRPFKKLVLFDVDGTLSLARQVRLPAAFARLRSNETAESVP
jgi:phosphomannomutase